LQKILLIRDDVAEADSVRNALTGSTEGSYLKAIILVSLADPCAPLFHRDGYHKLWVQYGGGITVTLAITH
jgi:hypothetical protein